MGHNRTSISLLKYGMLSIIREILEEIDGNIFRFDLSEYAPAAWYNADEDFHPDCEGEPYLCGSIAQIYLEDGEIMMNIFPFGYTLDDEVHNWETRESFPFEKGFKYLDEEEGVMETLSVKECIDIEDTAFLLDSLIRGLKVTNNLKWCGLSPKYYDFTHIVRDNLLKELKRVVSKTPDKTVSFNRSFRNIPYGWNDNLWTDPVENIYKDVYVEKVFIEKRKLKMNVFPADEWYRNGCDDCVTPAQSFSIISKLDLMKSVYVYHRYENYKEIDDRNHFALEGLSNLLDCVMTEID
jgi:hypothetical protein